MPKLRLNSWSLRNHWIKRRSTLKEACISLFERLFYSPIKPTTLGRYYLTGSNCPGQEIIRKDKDMELSYLHTSSWVGELLSLQRNFELSSFERLDVKIWHIQRCHRHKSPQGIRTESIQLFGECLLWFVA